MLAVLKGYRTILVNGAALLVSVLVMLGVLSLETASAIDPNVIADNAEAVANAADNISNTEAVAAGVAAAVALTNLVLRLFTTTAIGKK